MPSMRSRPVNRDKFELSGGTYSRCQRGCGGRFRELASALWRGRSWRRAESESCVNVRCTYETMI